MIEQLETPKKWYEDSILFKLGVITVIILILLIPSSWIQDLISERAGYQQQMINGMTDNWSGSHLVQGPVLVLPYKKSTSQDTKNADHDGFESVNILPENLKINADVKTQQFESGVHDVIVYNSSLALNGNFNALNTGSLGINPDEIAFDRARLVFSISDLKGLKNNPVVNIDGKEYHAEPATDINSPLKNALQVTFPLQKDKGIIFYYRLDLKGSNELNFLPTGKTTDVAVTSDWKNPGFNGHNLPDSRTVNSKGFVANWHTLYYNRPFLQQWLGNDTLLTSKTTIEKAQFGVKLQVPVEQYHKIMRTAKYAILIILLTFISLFLTELIKKQNIHLFNYTLIGAAMVVYYTLLLSFSEQIGYGYAYLVSSVSTILLIAAFTASLLKNTMAAVVFAIILSVFYGFIYIIIELEELSLLFGSIGLFVIVAMIMYFSRKINWDKR